MKIFSQILPFRNFIFCISYQAYNPIGIYFPIQDKGHHSIFPISVSDIATIFFSLIISLFLFNFLIFPSFPFLLVLPWAQHSTYLTSVLSYPEPLTLWSPKSLLKSYYLKDKKSKLFKMAFKTLENLVLTHTSYPSVSACISWITHLSTVWPRYSHASGFQCMLSSSASLSPLPYIPACPIPTLSI